MNKSFWIALLILSFTHLANAQSETETRSYNSEIPSFRTPAILISMGLVTNPEYGAFKSSVAYNNLFWQRMGLYTSIEVGVSNDYFSNIYGVTGTINEYFYAFGGVDLFTRYGLFTPGGIRKELGLGFIPFDFGVFKAGWSFDVGLTLEAGVRIGT